MMLARPQTAHVNAAATCQAIPTASCGGSSRRLVVARVASTDVKERVSDATDPDPKPLRKIADLPREDGLPGIGVLLKVMDESQPIEDMFKALDTDAFVVNLGPGGGRFLALKNVDDMIEASITKAKFTYPKWAAPVEDLIMPQGESQTNEQIRPWRVATGRILSHGTVMKLQLPLMVSEFTATIRELATKEQEIKWYNISKRLTFSAACRAAIGDVLNKKELDDLFPIASTVGKGVFSVSFGFKDGIPFTSYWQAKRAQRELQEILCEIITNILEDRDQLGGRDTVVKKVLEALEEEGIDTVTDREAVTVRLAKEVIMLMFVGTDTTSYTMSRCMIWLSKHPEWLQALNEEQDRLIAEHGPELTPKVLTSSAVALAVTQEVLRLTPPMKVTYRRTMKDLTIGNIDVPEGTDLMLAPRQAILETGSGKKEFDPQHWLSEDRTQCTPNDSMANMVFGAGPRNCIGKHLAMIETICFLAVLGREVGKVDMDPTEYEQNFFIIGDHPTGLPLTLTSRT